MARGHLRYLTRESDGEKVARCAPIFRPIVEGAITAIEWMLRAHGMNGVIHRVFETDRSPEKQLAAYAKGRMRTPLGWVVTSPASIVTNALLKDAPHCVRYADGRPAAMAADIWMLDSDTGELIADEHPAWALVPAAAFLAGGTAVVCGAFFTRPRDWPHFEHQHFRLLAPGGILREAA